ncbi:anti-phage deoxyguanosine triphosphatase [Pantoea cypripedii]|uniref:Deoxyguanosinetriphosphate triphosphohydrolase-like protein n=1 Tax=Pantoea cypripedii TaxID=55209 RepID=A0A6B9GHM1_PANCY|nr:anti-phage deoxyguanosine triphosphatase [Pantoea cypripedii]QGY33225.1 dGTPase [Pantoea cypripedii]
MDYPDKDQWEARRNPDAKRPLDYRSESKRDLARLIHSSPFRRLQSKTQVLGLGESDFYRTRLTHSMEVAQIGSGLLYVLKKENEDNALKRFLPDDDLMQAVCLAHDIGHPPFGHGGEVALNHCMKEFGGFEGNGQTLRLLSRLDKYTEKHGMNPTRRFMLGVLKYPASYLSVVNDNAYSLLHGGSNDWLFRSADNKPPKCYLDSENDVVDFILKPFGSSDQTLFRTLKNVGGDKHKKTLYKSLDTTIMDLADEISYSLHDLEDAISLNMITQKHWKEHFSDKAHIIRDCLGNGFNDTFDSLEADLFGKSHQRKYCIGKLVNLMITNVVLVTQNNQFKSELLRYKAALPFNIEALRASIFDLVKDKVIHNENVQQLEFKGQKVVVELFNVLVSDPMRFLPESARKNYKEARADSEMHAMRTICDYVAGMTDEYATRFYEKMFYPRKGSVFDKL